MNTPRHLIHPRDAILHTIGRIYRYRMTTTSGGNLSIREPNGDIWVTPARLDKGSLRREDIVRVRADGVVEGAQKPSSEFPFHKAIYELRPDLNSVVHAHPVALVAASISRHLPNTRLLHQVREICGDVGFAPYALPGSEALGRSVAATFAKGFNCVIMENHGVVVGGSSLQSAFERFETLEFAVKTIIKASLLGEVRYLTDEQIAAAHDNRPPIPAFAAETPSSYELELRKQLSEFVQRAYRQRLVISTEGSFSARVDHQSFLITPRGIDRNSLSVEDLVLIQGGRAEAGKTPSRASWNHQAIYERHPEIKAIINAYPVNATAFSVTELPLDARTIPESYICLREVQRLPHGIQFKDGAELAASVSPEQPIALVQNDGAQICGTSVLDAFDRLEVLESTAEAIINSRPLGKVAPMSHSVIEELVEAFLK